MLKVWWFFLPCWTILGRICTMHVKISFTKDFFAICRQQMKHPAKWHFYYICTCNISIRYRDTCSVLLDFFTVFYCNCHQHKKLLLRIQPRKRNCPLGPSFFVIHHFFGSKYEKYIYNLVLVMGQLTDFGFLVMGT